VFGAPAQSLSEAHAAHVSVPFISLQLLLEQSPAAVHVFPLAHGKHDGPPQSTSLSASSFIMLMHVDVMQTPCSQTIFAPEQSASFMQVLLPPPEPPIPELELDEDEDDEELGPETVEGGFSPPQLIAEANPREKMDTKNEYERVRVVMLLLPKSRCAITSARKLFLLFPAPCDLDP
jgi:hypothetical protein